MTYFTYKEERAASELRVDIMMISILMHISYYISAQTKDPHLSYEWVIMIFWLLTATFIIMIYKSNLAAVFTIPKQTPMPFDSVEEMLSQVAVPYRLIKGGFEEGTKDVRR